MTRVERLRLLVNFITDLCDAVPPNEHDAEDGFFSDCCSDLDRVVTGVLAKHDVFDVLNVCEVCLESEDDCLEDGACERAKERLPQPDNREDGR